MCSSDLSEDPWEDVGNPVALFSHPEHAHIAAGSFAAFISVTYLALESSKFAAPSDTLRILASLPSLVRARLYKLSFMKSASTAAPYPSKTCRLTAIELDLVPDPWYFSHYWSWPHSPVDENVGRFLALERTECAIVTQMLRTIEGRSARFHLDKACNSEAGEFFSTGTELMCI